MDSRPPTENQLAKELPGPTTYLTGHDASGKAVVHSRRPVKWTSYDSGNIGITSQFPPDLNGDADVAAHDATLGPDGTSTHGLVRASGTVLRFVDFAPGVSCMMHRTQSLDYGVVLEGEIESVLDSGEVTRMGRGDVMVQRATMHAWRNPSPTQWARMIFCLQDCKPLVVAGERLKEDLGVGMGDNLPASGNDAE
ncbi:cupin domain-containing protein [Magnaporthiopsis poae ATCC 64411]|uniref:Cupin domain-containing protein n=1 Tax=Magnaporthiopsis poae (strain ATCC 64411 / 73-15) TaxID=644358 RepID=A0A0C4EBT4_MAGP6|nr:cupin domain-containing protein [Magnaporthiopsis poae ATCC 64411]